jgi:hypothetical protein
VTKKKAKDNKLRNAYLLSVLGFFIPSWIGSGLATSADENFSTDPAFISALVFFGLSCWAPSLGLIYLGKKRYGFLSGLGRVVLIAGIVGLDIYLLSQLPEGKGHAYLSFLGIALAFIWGLVDFILIGTWAGKKKD